MSGVSSTSSSSVSSYSASKGTTSFDGIVSGFNTTDIVNQLLSIDGRQQSALKAKKLVNQDQQTTWKQVAATLLSFKLDAYSLSRETLFSSKTITSSNSDVLTASVVGTPPDGTYSIVVNKLAQANQLLSAGYQDQDATAVGAGDITFEFGNGRVNRHTKLDELNGQQGVARGSIKITDRNGSTATLDMSSFTDVQEVIDAINKNSDIDVTASINTAGNGINLVGDSGAGNLKVEDMNGGTTAADLGIKSSGAASISGSSVLYLTTDTKLNMLNDGNGMRTVAGNDLRITKQNGTTVDVDLGSATKISDVISAIQTADTEGTLTVSLVDDGAGNKLFKLTDSSIGGTTLATSSLNSSHALADLGLDVAASGNTITGSRVLAGMDTVLLKSLHGGSGVNLTQNMAFTLHNGVTYTVEAVGFSSARTMQDVIDAINNDADATGHFLASVNASGNGIQVADMTSGTTSFSIASNATTDATTGLGIASTGTSASTIKGASLELKYISENTLLTSLNAGDGAAKGVVKFTSKNGSTFNIDFNADYIKTMGDVIDKINTSGAAYQISARVNDTGDGLLITDASGGSGNLSIDNYGGTFATDLNIKGSTTGVGTTLDGAFEYTINISSTDKLEDVRDKINAAGYKVRAAIINDGASTGPYKLMLTSKNTGETGQISMDINLSGGDGLTMKTIASAQNAVFTLGSQGIGSTPTVISKSTNTITDVLTGVSLQLKSVSTSATVGGPLIPVTLGLANDIDTIQKSLSTFVEDYNKTISLINDLTRYDAATKTAGPLQGNYTINQIKSDLFSMLTNVVEGADSTVNNIGSIGLSFGDDGTISLDKDTFTQVAQTNLDAIKQLFTLSVNVGSASNGASATSSAAEAGYSAAGAIDGNTSYQDFNEQLTGWKASGGTGTYLQLDLGTTRTLQRFDLYSMDTSSNPASTSALKSFDFDYWDAASNSWKTEKSFSTNSGGRIVYYFSSPITTSKVRINNAVGNDSYARVTELQVYESRGVGKRLDDLIAALTDSTTGSIFTESEAITEENSSLDQQISVWDDRLAAKADSYRKKFNDMEKAMEQFKSTGNWLSSQITAMASAN